MEKYLFCMIVAPLAAFFTGIGVYARKRKKPMWFWSGSEVKPWQIQDVSAYNKANGWMWIVFSLVFWAAALLSLFDTPAAGILLVVGCLVGIPGLVIAYGRIYRRYKA